MSYTYFRLREKYALKIDQGQRQGHYLFRMKSLNGPCDLRQIRYCQVDHMHSTLSHDNVHFRGTSTLSRDNAHLGEIVHTFLNDAQVGRCISVSGQWAALRYSQYATARNRSVLCSNVDERMLLELAENPFFQSQR